MEPETQKGTLKCVSEENAKNKKEKICWTHAQLLMMLSTVHYNSYPTKVPFLGKTVTKKRK